MTPLLLSLVLAQASGPFARARLEPSAVVSVGQPVSIVVDVLVPSYFMGAPRFPDIDVSDALVVFEPRGVNFTERVGAETFAAQSRRYTIYPQRAGEYVVSEIPVGVRYFSGSGPSDGTVSPDPVRFRADVPPDARGLGYFIATSELTVEQRLEPETGELRVGDAMSRTVTVTVKDALSMVIPPVSFDAASRIAVYPEPPLVNDTGGERGSAIVGTRVEAASFVAEKEGTYRLPAIELQWWDVAAEQLRTASAPAVEFVVVANPELVSEFALPEELEPAAASVDEGTRVDYLARFGRRAAVLGALALLIVVGIRVWTRESRAEAHEVSEASLFRQFRAAALSGDAAATARTLMAWLDRRHCASGPALFHDFQQSAGDAELRHQAGALDETLYGAQNHAPEWSGRDLYRAVARARRQRPVGVERDRGLRPLNPGSR